MVQTRSGLNTDSVGDSLGGRHKTCKRLGSILTFLVELVVFVLWLPQGTPITGRNIALAGTRATLYVGSSGVGYALVATIKSQGDPDESTWVTTSVQEILGVTDTCTKATNRKKRGADNNQFDFLFTPKNDSLQPTTPMEQKYQTSPNLEAVKKETKTASNTQLVPLPTAEVKTQTGRLAELATQPPTSTPDQETTSVATTIDTNNQSGTTPSKDANIQPDQLVESTTLPSASVSDQGSTSENTMGSTFQPSKLQITPEETTVKANNQPDVLIEVYKDKEKEISSTTAHSNTLFSPMSPPTTKNPLKKTKTSASLPETHQLTHEDLLCLKKDVATVVILSISFLMMLLCIIIVYCIKRGNDDFTKTRGFLLTSAVKKVVFHKQDEMVEIDLEGGKGSLNNLYHQEEDTIHAAAQTSSTI